MSDTLQKLLTLQVLTLMEVASLLRVSPHTVRKWVRSGRLRPIRLCRRLLFTPDDIARLLSEAK
jgi:excisionase family DNA binding protein